MTKTPSFSEMLMLYDDPEGIGPVVERRQRKPGIGRQIAQAERAGKTVTSITTPDGVTLHFGASDSDDTRSPDPKWN